MNIDTQVTAGKLYIARHGQSAANVAQEYADTHGEDRVAMTGRDADTPLSAMGEVQAGMLGYWLSQLPPHCRPDAIMSSPFVRAHQTAAIVASYLGIAEPLIGVDERLREKEFGILDGYTRKGILGRFPDVAALHDRVGKFYSRPPGGENWCDVILRLRSVIDDIRLTRPDCRLLVVGHQVIVNCFRYLLEGMREEEILAIDKAGNFPNGGFVEYDVHPGPPARFVLKQGCFVVPGLRASVSMDDGDEAPIAP